MTYCSHCGKGVKKDFNFCPYCSHNIKQEKDQKDYGILGRDNSNSQNNIMPNMPFGLDKMLNSLMGQLNKELGQMGKEVKINFSSNIPGFNQNNQQPKTIIKRTPISQEKLEKISKLPRKEAKSETKRINNTIVITINLPGVTSLRDVILNKLETSLEIKAISDKVLYTKTISLNKLLRYRLLNEVLTLEFQG
ncbi:MAG: zinc ribbon domain-containing protein [Nanoarchaeota archaeon]|nr:zinc ribbon domain-containing protein [Nanoarchaeota archaeon]